MAKTQKSGFSHHFYAFHTLVAKGVHDHNTIFKSTFYQQ